MSSSLTLQQKRYSLIGFELFMFKKSKITNTAGIYKKIVSLQKADALDIHVLYNKHLEYLGLNTF